LQKKVLIKRLTGLTMFLWGKIVVGLTERNRYTSFALGTTSICGVNIVGANSSVKKKEKLKVESNTYAKHLTAKT